MEPDSLGLATSRQTTQPSELGILADVLALWRELLGLGHDRFRLAALETQLAGRSLVVMLMAGIIAAILLVSAWLGLMAALVLWAINLGLEAGSAVMLSVIFNLLLALFLWGVIHRNSQHLLFPASQRSFSAQPIADKHD
ncbi:MAG: phage holin family protein [Methylococcales bacterium]|nr:phage holin family protein [Methylococcales bacterium]